MLGALAGIPDAVPEGPIPVGLLPAPDSRLSFLDTEGDVPQVAARDASVR